MPGKSFRKYIFAVCTAVLLLWYPDILFNDNSLSRALPVLSFCESGYLYFDDYAELTGDKSHINGHVYSDKAPLPVLLVIPFAKSAQLAGFLPENTEAKIKFILALGGYIVSALPLFILMLWLFNHFEKTQISNRNFWLATLPFVSAFLWVYSASFYSHILAGFLLILSYRTMQKNRSFLSGLLGGAAFLTEYTVIVLPVIWLVQYVWKNRNPLKLLNFSLGFLPAFLLLIFYNYSISGNFFSLGYDHVDPAFAQMKTNYGFGVPKLEAIWGLTISLFRGVFIYAPVLLPLLFFAYKHIAKNASIKSFTLHPWLLPLIFYIILISAYFMWWGGWSFGPRHLIPIVLFILFYEFRSGIAHRNFTTVLVFAALGFIIVFSAKITAMYGMPSAEKNPLMNIVLPQLLAGNFHTQSLPVIFLGVSAYLSAFAWLLFYLASGILFSISYKKY